MCVQNQSVTGVTGTDSYCRGQPHPAALSSVSACSVGTQVPMGYERFGSFQGIPGTNLKGEEAVESGRVTYGWPHGPWQSWGPQRSTWSRRAWWALDAGLALFTLRFVETSVRERAPGCRAVPPQCHAPGEALPWALGEAVVG